MGVKFGTSWRNFREFSKTPSWREFLKNGLESNFLEKIFIGDFHVKLKVSFEFFTRDFPGNFFVPKRPR